MGEGVSEGGGVSLYVFFVFVFVVLCVNTLSHSLTHTHVDTEKLEFWVSRVWGGGGEGNKCMQTKGMCRWMWAWACGTIGVWQKKRRDVRMCEKDDSLMIH